LEIAKRVMQSKMPICEINTSETIEALGKEFSKRTRLVWHHNQWWYKETVLTLCPLWNWSTNHAY
jgi:hypothetical protein